MTEFQSRRELREAERQGLVPKPEQVFDLPTGQINIPGNPELQTAQQPAPVAQDLPAVSEMLTRKRIREMERQGLLDPLTGALPIAQVASTETRPYDEVLAETEEPITSSISAVNISSTPAVPVSTPFASQAPVPPTDIFHSMAVDINARKPRVGLFIAIILVVLAGLGAAAYTLGIFK